MGCINLSEVPWRKEAVSVGCCSMLQTQTSYRVHIPKGRVLAQGGTERGLLHAGAEQPEVQRAERGV